MSERMIVQGPLILPHGLVDRGEVVIESGRIAAVFRQPVHKHPTLRFRDHWVSPGLIDLHIHGGQGADVMDGTVSALAVIARDLAVQGTTGFLATTLTASVDALQRAFAAVRAYQDLPEEQAQGAAVLGVHMEGPFLNAAYQGAQNPDFLRNPSVAEMQAHAAQLAGQLKMMTIAPELPGAHAVVEWMAAHQVIASAGHSAATVEQGRAGIDSGIRHATHLFNAMPPMHHRQPGLAAALLLDKRVDLELICDGVHVHPDMVRLAAQMAGLSRVILITDAIRAAGLADGVYDLGGQPMRVSGGVARLAAGNLAGSTLRLTQAVVNF
ncbi:MAG: N-acetylglucosamine-6-phosphate deacetylase, partial [Firmicutes bacterium]|nr:N-acetylglucosamine-6-phosphate deacetylase [Bacillota bacterium]